MKIVLIFPPLADPTQPYSSLPTLTAYLNKRNTNKITKFDINIEFYNYILTSKYLQMIYEKIKIMIRQFKEISQPNKTSSIQYMLLVEAILKFPFIIETIDQAVKALKKSETFRDIARLNQYKRVIRDALTIISAPFYPLHLNYSNNSNITLTNSSEITRIAVDKFKNPFIDYFETYTLNKLESISPNAIGISITYKSQILPAVTLALQIKKKFPKTHVIFGGNIVSAWYSNIENCPEIFNWCDFLIPFEGERALDQLLLAIENDGNIDSIPNLVYLYDDLVRKNSIAFEDINELPTPDYSGLPFDLYLSPKIVFILYTSRGCYWSKCNFCSVSPSFRHIYRKRNIDLVYQDILTLNIKFNAKYISFADDCISPSILDALATKIEKGGPKIFWQCEVRFEEQFNQKLLKKIKQAGCLNLIFGLESYCPRVLSLMNKGIEHDLIEQILDDARLVGLAFNLQFFFGFPGETQEEAELTSNFILKQAYGSATFSFGTFELQKGTIVKDNPNLFGINKIYGCHHPLALSYRYSPSSPHANRMKKMLKEKVKNKTKFKYVGFSINAHTLIFLKQAGIDALNEMYGKCALKNLNTIPVGELLNKTIVPSKNINIEVLPVTPLNLIDRSSSQYSEIRERILVYNYDTDKTIEISKLALVVLQRLHEVMPLEQIIEQMLSEIDEPSQEQIFTKNILNIIEALYLKDFIVVSE